MKKFFITTLLLTIGFLSFAQIKKNSILLGGQLNYYSEKTEGDLLIKQEVESAKIGISIGKAFKENTISGINLTYSPMKLYNLVNGSDTFTIKNNRYEVGGFLREYKKIGKDFYFFGQLDGAFIIGYETMDYTIASQNSKIKQIGGFTSLTIGTSYKIFKKIQLELTIPNILGMQYLVTRSDYNNILGKEIKKEQFTFYSNLTQNTNLGFLGVGIRFLL